MMARLPVEILISLPQILDDDGCDWEVLWKLSLVNKIFLAPCQRILFNYLNLSSDVGLPGGGGDRSGEALFEKLVPVLEASPHLGRYIEDFAVSAFLLMTHSGRLIQKVFIHLTNVQSFLICGMQPDLQTLTGRDEHDDITGPTPWYFLPPEIRYFLQHRIFPSLKSLDISRVSHVPLSVLLACSGSLEEFSCTNPLIMDIDPAYEPPQECHLKFCSIVVRVDLATLDGVEDPSQLYKPFFSLFQDIFPSAPLSHMILHAYEIEPYHPHYVQLGQILQRYRTTLQKVSLNVIEPPGFYDADFVFDSKYWSDIVESAFDFSDYPHLSRLELKARYEQSLIYINKILSKFRGSTKLKDVAIDMESQRPPWPDFWKELNITLTAIPSIDRLILDYSDILEEDWIGEDRDVEIQRRFDEWSDQIMDCLPHFGGERPDVYFELNDPAF